MSDQSKQVVKRKVTFDLLTLRDPVRVPIMLTKAEAIALYALVVQKTTDDPATVSESETLFTYGVVGMEALGIEPENIFDKLEAVFQPKTEGK